MKKRIIGIDFGIKRIGIALSDEGQRLATPICAVLAGKNHAATAQNIKKEIGARGPFDAIVIGMPLLLNGQEGSMAQAVRLFAAQMEEVFGVKVIFWDERLTTLQVERTLKEAEMNRKKRAALIDALAAAVILQNYLDRL